MSWCYFSEVKKTIRKSLFLYSKTNTNNFDFFSQRVSTWQNDNWKPMETTCNSQQYLYLIFCIYFAWPSLLRNVEPCGVGERERNVINGSSCYASPRQFSHTRFIFFTPKVPDPQQFDYCCCFHSSSTGHGNSIQIGRFSPLIPFE